MKYKIVPLGKVAKCKGGYAFKSENFICEGIPIIRIGNIVDDKVTIDENICYDKSFVNGNEQFLVNYGDILVAMSGATTGKIGRYLYEKPSILNQRVGKFQVISPDLLLDDYLYFFVKSSSFQNAVRNAASGCAQPNVSSGQIEKIQIPLPAIQVQKEITLLLAKAEQIFEKRRMSDMLMNHYLQSVFFEMFGDPMTNLKGWEVRKFGTIVTDIQAGWSISGESRSRNEDEFGVLKISAVTTGRFIATEHKAVNKEDVVKKIITPQRGDLLFSRANTRELVAATCIVEEDYPNLFLPDKLWRIIPDTKKVYGEYLKSILSYPQFRENLALIATGSHGSMLNISMDKLREIYLPVPPLSLQEKFREIFWSIYKLQAKAEKSKVELDALFKSLQDSFIASNK